MIDNQFHDPNPFCSPRLIPLDAPDKKYLTGSGDSVQPEKFSFPDWCFLWMLFVSACVTAAVILSNLLRGYFMAVSE